MTEFKIKDNTTISKYDFDEVRLITKKVLDKTLGQLEKEGVFVFPELLKDAEDITKEQIILQSVNDCYRSSNVMGFLGYGKERLIIKSRFSTVENDYFFQYLIENVLEIPNVLDLNTDANQDNRLFNLLLFLFPYYLKIAMRKGLFKTYIRSQYNDGNVKGTVDIARHIRDNTPFTGKIAYNQREFSYDNSIMELIRHTIEFIKKRPYGNNVLRKAYEYYDRRKIIIKNKKKPISHAYYHEYRNLQRLCIMILQQEKHQIGLGMTKIHGILFDGSWLWEEYINTLIGNNFYHPMNKGRKGAQRLFDGNIGLIYPDFISRNATNRIIADAKYKPLGNIGNKDYLQVLAYMFRFDAKKGLYLYPENGKVENQLLKMNRGLTYEDNVEPRTDIQIIKCGLKIPTDAKDYDEFKHKIKTNEVAFINQLKIYSCDIKDN